MLTRKNVGNTSENVKGKCRQHSRKMLTKKMLATLPENVDEKILAALRENVDEKNVGNPFKKC
jgi:hypothetical protein